MSGTGVLATLALFLASPAAASNPEADRRSLRDCPLPAALSQRWHRESWSDEVLLKALVEWRAARPDRYAPTAPPPDGVKLVPDFAPMETLYLALPGWLDHDTMLVKAITAASRVGRVHASVMSPDDLERLKRKLVAAGAVLDHVTFASSPPLETIWIRDFGPVPVSTPEGMGAIDFEYAVDCVENDAYPSRLGGRVWRSDLIVDGGNLMTDGLGSCFTTTGILETTALDRDAVTAALRTWAGCERVVMLDPLQGNVIDHVDMMLTPAPDGVLLLASFDADEDPVNHAVMVANRKRLEAWRAEGGPAWTLVDIPAPRPLPVPGDDPIVRSWNNVLPFNGIVLVPDYSRTDESRRAAAWARIARAFPGRELVAVPSDPAILTGGAVHCLGRAMPAASAMPPPAPDPVGTPAFLPGSATPEP